MVLDDFGSKLKTNHLDADADLQCPLVEVEYAEVFFLEYCRFLEFDLEKDR